MKKINRLLLPALLIATLIFPFSRSPVFAQKLKRYDGDTLFSWSQPTLDKDKKTVFVVAENDGTEMFDLMAPFYLFNATGQANVFVVSETKGPILLVNSLFILPHYSFSEIDSLHITPDVIVIPNLNVRLTTPPKPGNVNWIKSQVSSETIVLSICDGSATAAATGLYDGKPITTHATDFNKLKKQFPKARWVKNTSVTESGNLYSTAGVSNAVEGTLTVIRRIFGEETMLTVLKEIRYPHATVQTEHISEPVGAGTVARIVSKVLFRKKNHIGVLLTDNVNEFQLASLLDTYARTFPSSINTFSIGNVKTISKFGLTFYPSATTEVISVNEIHLLDRTAMRAFYREGYTEASVVTYDSMLTSYPIDACLDRIQALYGEKFKDCVKVTLDYN